MEKTLTNPTLPKSKINPTQTTKIERRTNAVIQSRFELYWKALSKLINKQKFRLLEVNGFRVNAQFYAYQLDELSLEELDGELKRLLDRYLLSPNPRTKQHFIEQAAAMGYESGEVESLLNFEGMTDGAYPRQVEFVLRSQPYLDRIAYVKSRALEDFKGFTDSMSTDIRRLLVDGMANGDNPNVIARKIRAQVLGNEDRKGAVVRAKRIARTEITGAHRRALWDEDQRANDEGIKTKLLHVSALIVGRTRATHAAKHGYLWPTRKALQDWYQVDANGINCFLPDTEVSGRFIAGSKAFYEGEVIRFVTAGGRNISVTPNHPMMSKFGLIAAAKFREGDNLVAYISDVEPSAGVSDLHIKKTMPKIKDVFASLMEIGHSSLARVGAVDFHGDAEFIKEDVDVVSSDRFLTYAVDSHSFEMLDNLALKHANLSSFKFSSLGKCFNRVFLSASRLLRSLGNSLGVFLGSILKSKCLRIGHIPNAKAFSFKPAIKCYSGYANFIGKLKNRLAFNVLSMKVWYVKHMPYSSRIFNAASVIRNLLKESSVRDSDIFTDAFDGLASKVSFDRIIKIERSFYSGHVYDLQESSGLMIANEIITSNCLCTQTSAIVDDSGNILSKKLAKKMIENKEKYLALVAKSSKVSK